MNTMMDASGAPTGASNMGAMPGGIGTQVLGNLQQASQAQTSANAQQLADNAARTPSLGGAMQSLMRQNQQTGANQGYQAQQTAQAAGAQMQNSNNNVQADQAQQAQQNQLNRMLQQQQMDMQTKLQSSEEQFASQQADIDRIMGLVGAGSGAGASAGAANAKG